MLSVSALAQHLLVLLLCPLRLSEFLSTGHVAVSQGKHAWVAPSAPAVQSMDTVVAEPSIAQAPVSQHLVHATTLLQNAQHLKPIFAQHRSQLQSA